MDEDAKRDGPTSAVASRFLSRTWVIAKAAVMLPFVIGSFFLGLLLSVLLPFAIITEAVVPKFRPPPIGRTLRWWEDGADVSWNVVGAVILLVSVLMGVGYVVLWAWNPRWFPPRLQTSMGWISIAWAVTVSLIVILAVTV